MINSFVFGLDCGIWLLWPCGGNCLFGNSHVFISYPKLQMLPSRLRSTLKRIRDELILQGPADGSLPDEGASPRDVGAGLEACLKLAAPCLSPCLDSTEDAASFFCFAERVAASESLFYLTQQMERLRAHVEKLVPFGDKHLLQQFYGTTLTQAAELRRPIYRIDRKSVV